ncbi:hypothetical protein ACFSTI_02440 [Rhizorhabdus histidinilytica]
MLDQQIMHPSRPDVLFAIDWIIAEDALTTRFIHVDRSMGDDALRGMLSAPHKQHESKKVESEADEGEEAWRFPRQR